MNRFWDLLERSVIVQGTVTLGIVGTILYLYVTGQEVPSNLQHLTGLLLGFWFGTKVTYAQLAHYGNRKG